MSTPDTGSDDYRAGFLAGYTDRQAEIDTLEDLADRYYRKAYVDERRIPADTVTLAELEQRRQLLEPPVEVTRAAALASWGITTDTTTAETDQAPTPTAGEDPARTTRTARRRPVSSRTIIGNLAVDPEVVQAGRVKITKLRVIEDTGEYRGGKYLLHPDATTHFVEAKFELGENTAATLRKGDAVIVVGREHTASWGPEGTKSYGRVVEADHIGVDLSRAVADVRKVPRESNDR
ncbi:hypothetical protein B7R22_17805 [Subtercola boreus]|uniref:Single-stranded DNA-binding protein n=1 Tax=Subtercola boreus TaxID=120213 RepID=A0A3E0VPG4_9MICO|nr:single-stranded DNA-binding protein [Subtercola boreus]RFA11786.1 hypothetical protein B7R22_17805 [Subtercola boreus]